jgi:hypothetical protein
MTSNDQVAMEGMEEHMPIRVLGRYIAMDRMDELKIGVGKLNLLIDMKIVCTLGV